MPGLGSVAAFGVAWVCEDFRFGGEGEEGFLAIGVQHGIGVNGWVENRLTDWFAIGADLLLLKEFDVNLPFDTPPNFEAFDSDAAIDGFAVSGNGKFYLPIGGSLAWWEEIRRVYREGCGLWAFALRGGGVAGSLPIRLRPKTNGSSGVAPDSASMSPARAVFEAAVIKGPHVAEAHYTLAIILQCLGCVCPGGDAA